MSIDKPIADKIADGPEYQMGYYKGNVTKKDGTVVPDVVIAQNTSGGLSVIGQGTQATNPPCKDSDVADFDPKTAALGQ